MYVLVNNVLFFKFNKIKTDRDNKTHYNCESKLNAKLNVFPYCFNSCAIWQENFDDVLKAHF